MRDVRTARPHLPAAILAAVLMGVCGWFGAPAYGSFGIEAFDQQISAGPSGDVFTQAGGHPFDIATEIELNHHADPAFGLPVPDAETKDLITKLPPGLFGNPVGIAQCTLEELAGEKKSFGEGVPPIAECPVAAQVGIIEVRFSINSVTAPLYNLVPPTDKPALFGFDILGVNIAISGTVRNGGDFGIDVSSLNISNTLPISGITITFWGVPADSRHDFQRCQTGSLYQEGSLPAFCAPLREYPLSGPQHDPELPKAFLTLPVACTPSGVGFKTTLQADSWEQPGAFDSRSIFSHEPPGYPLEPAGWGPQVGITGCDFVPFDPSVRVEPSTHQADTPSGLLVEFSLPQDGLLASEGIATSDVKNTVVALPAGVSVSPSAADGLGACSLEQIGLDNGLPPSCPDSSKMGSVEIVTPLLPDPMHGAIYLGRQAENPFGSLIALYIVVEGHGVIIKIPGKVDLDPVTGQLVSTFDNSPQLPFSHLRIQFKGGPRSPLVNPHECGTYTTTAVMTPWSGDAPANMSSAFQITSGPGGAPCPSPRQFAPGFALGTTSNQAGGFSPLSVTMTRSDGDEQLGGIVLHTPTGLLGTLSSVSLCPEPQAAQGTCGADSQIGTVTAGAGAGANPFFVTGGKIYITGPYNGAPFGLSVVVPAKAGPFDLGTVVVRGTISVDPHNASLTITTFGLPTILDGIPLDLRLVNVKVDRPGFIFNPTNCDSQAITGTLTGDLGDVEPFSDHFQVTNCAILGFKPSFRVSTNGKTSRANGASLNVKLTYPKNSFGHQINLAKVKVDLPKQLPSRLNTLQKACPGETFQKDPAACPQASKIGVAKAKTPVIPAEFSGPMYFVSHGGEAWPDLVIVLQGYNVTIQLVGTTFINEKTGVTSTTFNTIPDVPVESFELKLPQGQYSALAANGNLCTSKLRMPTLFVGQDGATIKQSTPITAAGCPKHKPHHKKHKHKKGKGK